MSKEIHNHTFCQTDVSGSAFSIHDLKCGNILNYYTAEGEILPTVIDWQDLKWLSEDPKGFNLVHSPIPLTEEWLLNFGFNKEYKDGYIGIDIGNTDFVLTYPKVMGDFQTHFAFQFHSGGWSKFREIKYVHELQNLFRSITGVELVRNDR